MLVFISIIISLVCVLLILVVLVQNSKGGGLASTFQSSNQIMGVRKTADFLEKSTWTLAIALLALSLLTTPYTKSGGADAGAAESVTRKKAETMPVSVPEGFRNNNSAPVPDSSSK